MTMTPVRRGALALTLCALVAASAGCNDGHGCPAEIIVMIQAPEAVIVSDSDPALAGVQTPVVVRSNVPAGTPLVLTVEDDAMTTLASATAIADGTGVTTFPDVTVPAGGAVLRVVGDAGRCGGDQDQRTVEVAVGADCTLAFATPPLVNEHYAPIGVLNLSLDGDPERPGFQGDVVVTTSPGHDVLLLLQSPGATETEIGRGTATAAGEVRLAVDLPEGLDHLRARCATSTDVGSQSSGLVSVWVDTVAPTCAVTSPVPTTSITLALDEDHQRDNGVQLELVGHADGDDVVGEAASFVLTAPDGALTTLSAAPVDAAGNAAAKATFAPPSPPANYGVRFTVGDHAGNTCAAAATYRVVYDGCPITVTRPLGTVTSDADANPSNGAQVDIGLAIGADCVGRPVTSDCGANDPGATVGAGGVTSLRATVCAQLPCEASQLCTVSVTSGDGIETTAGVALEFDNLPPSVTVQLVAPAGVGCGDAVSEDQDVDPVAAGVQVRVQVVSPLAADRRLRVTTSAGTTTLDANVGGGELVVTLANGANDFVGVAADAAGNTTTSGSCPVTLADIGVGFTGPAADGLIGAPDGAVAGGNLTFALTGSVSLSGATVEVAVDGGAPAAATVSGSTWSLPLTLAGGATPYHITATATAGPRVGLAGLHLTVDVTGPTLPPDLTATAVTRHSIAVAFDAPDDNGATVAGYLLRYSTTALTDGNFDGTGVAAASPVPAAPGTAQGVTIDPVRTGTPYWVAVAAVDAAGNRSAARIAGPVTPAFDATPAYLPPNTAGNAGYGAAIVRGRFNDDLYEDVAIGAPSVTANGIAAAGEVYIYFGSATGLATTPAVTIRGTVAGGQFGSSLARIHWSSPTRDDLAVGAPFAQTISVFNGGAALPTGTVNASVAQRRIVASVSNSWFSGCGLGWQLATSDHDGDGTEDLIATAVFGAAGSAGAALVFFGGTVPTGTVAVSDVDPAGSGTARIRMYEIIDPDFPGMYLHNLGRTQGEGDLTDDFAVGFSPDRAVAEVLVFRGAGRPALAGVTREPFTVGRDVRLRYVTSDSDTAWGATMGSIADQNGDGARDLVISAPREGASDHGRVLIIDGATVGTGGVASTSTAGVVIADYQATGAAAAFGSVIVNNANAPAPDVDGDGHEDLLVARRGPVQAELLVWFGPVPTGIWVDPEPDLLILGATALTGALPPTGGTAITAAWVDVNGDGLADICWADWTSNSQDGAMQILWDDHQ